MYAGSYDNLFKRTYAVTSAVGASAEVGLGPTVHRSVLQAKDHPPGSAGQEQNESITGFI
jgi:hypothetical protein